MLKTYSTTPIKYVITNGHVKHTSDMRKLCTTILIFVVCKRIAKASRIGGPQNFHPPVRSMTPLGLYFFFNA